MKFTKMDVPIRSKDMQQPRKPDTEGCRASKHKMPCTDCHKREGCIADDIACEAYLSYTNKPGAEDHPELWMNEPRNPTKRIFDYIWGNQRGRIR